MSTVRLTLALLCVVALAGCVSRPAPRPEARPGDAPRSAKLDPYEVFGRRYVPIQSADGYRERGVASWYGPKFNGRPTANGETFDMHGLTAAHKTLPLPTWVEVTNLRNNRRVVVRVNDRGPFVDNRLIDLSFAAARELDMVGPGTSLVDVRAVPAPNTPVATPPPAPAVAAVEKTFFIQVGAFSQTDNAARVRADLERGGVPGVTSQTVERDGQSLYRVRVGPVNSVEEFDALIVQLDALGYSGARLAID